MTLSVVEITTTITTTTTITIKTKQQFVRQLLLQLLQIQIAKSLKMLLFLKQGILYALVHVAH